MANRLHGMTFLLLLVLADLAQAQTFTTLHYFTGGGDGGSPYAGVIQDSANNIYGSASAINTQEEFGTVFKIGDPLATLTVLHSFSGSDGAYPSTPLVRDEIGNLYGTDGGGPADAGTIFKIDTAGDLTVLYSFTGGSDGCDPLQGLIGDKSGNLFGTTNGCGVYGGGTIFKVDRAGNFVLLYTFTGGGNFGGPRFGRLTMDKAGNLYGLTSGGGAYGYGALYELTRSGKFTILHSFNPASPDGCYPYGSVAQDGAGNFYGTTSQCASYGYGNIWKVSRSRGETILHSFAGGTSDGCYPWAGVTRDSKGTLYGVTIMCALHQSGALYKLTAKGRLTLLHSFNDSDGADPIGEVFRRTTGTLFGTTFQGGVGSSCVRLGCGTIWKYEP